MVRSFIHGGITEGPLCVRYRVCAKEDWHMNPGCTHIQQRSPSFLKRARPRLFHSGLSLERAHQGAQWARIPESGAGQRMRPGGQFSVFALASGVSKRCAFAASLEGCTQTPRAKPYLGKLATQGLCAWQPSEEPVHSVVLCSSPSCFNCVPYPPGPSGSLRLWPW